MEQAADPSANAGVTPAVVQETGGDPLQQIPPQSIQPQPTPSQELDALGANNQATPLG